jgi:hypothetical protein
MRMLKWLFGIALVLGFTMGAGFYPLAAIAHVYSPFVLTIKSKPNNSFELLWQAPDDAQGAAANLGFVIIEPCEEKEPTRFRHEDGFNFGRTVVDCGEQGLSGRRIEFSGLADTNEAIFVTLEMPAQPLKVWMMEGSRDLIRFDGPEGEAPAEALSTKLQNYTVLGIKHIGFGYDHLLFLVCLVLLFRHRWRSLVALATVFTLAHSISLTFAALGFFVPNLPPIEALIALSIVLMASEVVQSADAQPDRIRRVWPIIFLFGLIHGFGFAGALFGIGLPVEDRLWALLAFNVGVEIGQVVFILLILIPIGFLGSMGPRLTPKIAGYVIGTISGFWLAERVISFWA